MDDVFSYYFFKFLFFIHGHDSGLRCLNVNKEIV